jgi:DNA-directed RNA polymerase specialized sigma24 family protein
MDPEGLVQERELHETFVILLREHAQGSAHNADSANAIGLSLWESCTAKEIAEKFGCSVARAWKLFSRDYSDLRELLATKYGITEMRHL